MYGRNNYGYGGYGSYGGYPQGQNFGPMPNAGTPQFTQYQGGGQQVGNADSQKPSLQVPWVNGEVGAQAYLLPPNSTVLLMDSDNPIFYIKTSDLSGKASIQAFKYEELRQNVSTPIQQVNYVTKEEFEAFKASVLSKDKAEEEKTI